MVVAALAAEVPAWAVDSVAALVQVQGWASLAVAWVAPGAGWALEDSEVARLLPDLAGVAGLSIFHFARMFTLAVGVSPRRYIGRMRLERAMAEIAGGRSSLAKIAFDARFSSQASFTRAFRCATGMSPGEYRRRRVIGGPIAVSRVA